MRSSRWCSSLIVLCFSLMTSAGTALAQSAESVVLHGDAGERNERLVSPLAVILAGGALVVGGTVFAIVGQSKVKTIEDNCPQNLCPPDYDLEAAKADAQPFLVTADVLLISGIAVAGFGVLFALLDVLADSPPSQSSGAGSDLPTVACGPDGCMARVAGRF